MTTAAPSKLGVRFTTSTVGTVTAIKYYKPLGSYGQKTGHLWSASGTLLGAVTFGNESASGWQQAKLDTPVNLAANRTYTVSYLAPRGGYAATVQYFWGRSVVSGPLTAVAQSNGVYSYSRRATFPNQTYWKSPNYWVDVVFVPQAGSDTSSQSPPQPQSPPPQQQPTPSTTQPPVTTTTTQPPVDDAAAGDDDDDEAAVDDAAAGVDDELPVTTTTTQPPTQPQPLPTQPAPVYGQELRREPARVRVSRMQRTPGLVSRCVASPRQVTSGPGWHYDSRGWVVIDGTNAQVSGLAFTVEVSIEAAGVKLSDCEVREAGSMFPIAVRHAPNTTIDHCRITSPGANNLVGIKDIYGDSTDLTVTNNDIGVRRPASRWNQGWCKATTSTTSARTRAGVSSERVHVERWNTIGGRASQHDLGGRRSDRCRVVLPRLRHAGQQDDRQQPSRRRRLHDLRW